MIKLIFGAFLNACRYMYNRFPLSMSFDQFYQRYLALGLAVEGLAVAECQRVHSAAVPGTAGQ